MMRQFRAGIAIVALGVWSVLASPVGACAFHGYLPPETAVDRMFSADRVVSLRPSRSDPLRNEVVQVFRGAAGAGGAADMSDLIDTQTRLRLTANPGHSVLFARSAEDGTWQQLIYLDESVQPVMAQVLARLDDWIMDGDEDRFQFFADLLNHPHPDIQALALAELDRAPYSILDALQLSPDAEWLLQDFWAAENATHVPIKTLLLGLSGADAARIFLRGQFEDGGLPGGALAGAFAVALIEIDGQAGLAPVIEAARRAGQMGTPESVALIEALAIHAETGGRELQRNVRFQVSALIEAEPQLAPTVVRQFGIRSDWSQKAVIERLNRAGVFTDPAVRFDIDQYLRAAAQIDPLFSQ
ncbi:hypothetical protein [Shimia biformata]|uniref:hypothetical protein n=1 Tax=Shimia biformata TaxID=1294299 RepID=UPI001952503D|nr:hypothetical protein [Shimia biformata]